MRQRYRDTVSNIFRKHLSARYKSQKATVLAVVYSGSSLSAFAFNEKKTSASVDKIIKRNNITERYHGGEGYLNCTRHAEFNCLKKGSGDTMIVARQNANGDYRSARPCLVCAACMRERGIKRVFFSTDEGRFEEMDLWA